MCVSKDRARSSTNETSLTISIIYKWRTVFWWELRKFETLNILSNWRRFNEIMISERTFYCWKDISERKEGYQRINDKNERISDDDDSWKILTRIQRIWSIMIIMHDKRVKRGNIYYFYRGVWFFSEFVKINRTFGTFEFCYSISIEINRYIVYHSSNKLYIMDSFLFCL